MSVKWASEASLVIRFDLENFDRIKFVIDAVILDFGLKLIL